MFAVNDTDIAGYSRLGGDFQGPQNTVNSVKIIGQNEKEPEKNSGEKNGNPPSENAVERHRPVRPAEI